MVTIKFNLKSSYTRNDKGDQSTPVKSPQSNPPPVSLTSGRVLQALHRQALLDSATAKIEHLNAPQFTH